MPSSDNNKILISTPKEAVLATLAFFSIFQVPIDFEKLYKFLYKQQASRQDLKKILDELLANKKIVRKGNLYALDAWDEKVYLQNQEEIKKRFYKIRRFKWLLEMIPFVRGMSIINSLALGTADARSDIDFFVVTRKRTLYFVRTIIILLFKSLGLYKTKGKIKERFCFGFYVTEDNLDFSKVLLPGDDVYFSFWLASMQTVFGEPMYFQIIAVNNWVNRDFPNFVLDKGIFAANKNNKVSIFIKFLLETLLFIPAMIFEPLLTWIHIRHTYKLPENHWETSTTIANSKMLKLHSLDIRKEVRLKFFQTLTRLGIF